MNLKLLHLFCVLSFCLGLNTLSAQKPSDNSQKPFQVLKPESVTHVPSIASRMSELQAVDLTEEVEMQDSRSKLRKRKIKIIPGKGSSGDDALAAKQRDAKQVPNRMPDLVFETAASDSQPTDPSGAVGPNHYIAVTNTAFRIFDKNGNPLTGLLSPNPSIFPNSGCCDLTASYDNVADRWVLSFLGSGAQIAVSTGPDPVNDGWTVYLYSSVVDYQKLSVWHDGYYMTDNKNGEFHVFERAEMLAGNTGAQLVSFTAPEWQDTGAFDSPQFLNLSHNATVTGPATMIYIADDSWGSVTQDDHIKLWNVTMDWDNTSSSTITGPNRLGLNGAGIADGSVTPFISTFDGGSFSNLAQPGGGSTIDALQWTVMNQAQFRKFGSYNSALFNFVVDVDGSAGKLAGVRWYELRQTGDGQPWTIYQEGTYTAPDGRHAWNASLIMDGQGNIGMGYTSMSGPTTPSTVRVGSYYTGQLISESGTGTMNVAEEVILAGNGNIPGIRYGDYSKIDIDPADDKKFWFVNEVMENGRKNYCGVFQIAPNTTNDVGVISIDAPTDGSLSATESVTVTVFNFGQNAASGFNVTYQVDGGGVVTEAFPGTIASGASAQYTFSTTANLSIEGQTYAITACTNLTSDENNGNDCKTQNITHILSNDIGVTAITAPTTGALTNETVTVTIENFGSSDQTGFNATYSVDGGTPVSETVNTTVPAGGIISYSFTQTADLSTQGQTYSIQACTALSGDQNTGNDCTSTSVTNQLIVCEPDGDCTFDDGITMYQLGDIDVDDVPCSTGYEDLTANATDLDRSAGNNVHNGIFQTGYAPEHLSMWIDFNNNGDFTDAGELVIDTFVVPSGGNDIDQAFTITIPTTANLGTHLLRVRGYDPDFNGTLNDPCGDLQFGNTVDFTVNIIDSALSVDEFALNGSALNIVTNPNNQFDVILTTPYSEKLTFNVYNTLGQQLVYDVISKDNEGKYIYNLDMSYASSGVYIVKVGRGNTFKVGKIIVK